MQAAQQQEFIPQKEVGNRFINMYTFLTSLIM